MVRLPRDLVEWAAGQCPRAVLLAGAAEADDVLLDDGEGFHFCPSGCVAKTLDFRTGTRRPSTLDDVRSGTALLDEMSELDVMMTQVTATDVPLEHRELVEYHAILTETTRHVTFVDCPHEVDAVRAHRRGAVRRSRPLPRAAARLDGRDRGVTASGGRRGARRARRAGGDRRPGLRVLDGDLRGDVPGHAGRDRRSGSRGVPRYRHRAAGGRPRRKARLLLRIGRARHGTHHVLARLRRERPHGGRGHRGRSLPRRAHAEPGVLDRREVRRHPGRLREGAQGPHRLRGRSRPRLGVGRHRLAQHHVDDADRDRQRDRRDDPPSSRPGGGVGRHARRRRDRPGGTGRQLPRPKGDRAADPRRRTLHARDLRPSLVREVGGGGPDRDRHARANASSRSSRRAPQGHRT